MVFYAGGLGEMDTESPYRFIEDRQHYFTMPDYGTAKNQAILNSYEEFKRLFYVAYTRAESKIYLPFPDSVPGRWLLLQSLLGEIRWEEWTESLKKPPELPFNANKPSIKKQDKIKYLTALRNRLELFFRHYPDHFILSDPCVPPEKKYETVSSPEAARPELKAPAKISEYFSLRIPPVQSFSSLVHSSSEIRDQDPWPSEVPAEAVIPEVFHPSAGIETAGPVFGDFIHSLLEIIPFEWAASGRDEFLSCDELTDIFRKQALLHFSPEWHRNNRMMVLDMLYRTLTAPLLPDGSLRLCDIPPEDRIAEMEFLYYLQADEKPSCGVPEGVIIKKGYVKGFIDLVFRYREKYYIVDWKTNLPEMTDRDSMIYTPDVMKKIMDKHNYPLQFEIYRKALSLYLRRTEEGRDREDLIGGGFYLFVRGTSEEGRGIFRFN